MPTRGRVWLPLLFGTIYLLLIFGFAALYTNWSGEFLHTTVQHEPDFQRDAESILQRVHTAMADNYAAHYGHRNVGITTWDRIQLFHLTSEGPYQVHMSFAGDPWETPKEEGPVPLHLSLDLFWRRTADRVGGAHAYPINVEGIAEGLTIARDFFPMDRRFLEKNEHQQGAVGYVTLSDSLITDLKEWQKAERGFPSKRSWLFGRYLYLSAVTITTVGFGDIVPITDRARLAIAIEAVLGIVVIGSFINVVANQRNK